MATEANMNKLERIKKEWSELPRKTKFIQTCEFLLDFYQWLLGLNRDPQTQKIIVGPDWFINNSAAIKGVEESLQDFLRNQGKHYLDIRSLVFEKHLLPFYDYVETPDKNSGNSDKKIGRYIIKSGTRDKMLELLAQYYCFDLRAVPEKDRERIAGYVGFITNFMFLPGE